MSRSRFLRFLSFLPLAALLSGCKAVVLSPSGDIAIQQRDLIYVSVALMLIVIVLTIIQFRYVDRKVQY